MKTILFIIAESWYPDVCKANGSCIYELANYLKEKNNVYVASTKSDNKNANFIDVDGIKVYRSQKRLSYFFRESMFFSKNKFLKYVYIFFNKMMLPFNYFRYPFRDYLFATLMARNIKKNIKQIDSVVFVVNPVESYLVAKKIRKYYKNSTFFNYQVDSLSLSSGEKIYGLKNKIINYKLRKVERSIIKFSDYNLIMRSNKEEYSLMYKQYIDKIIFIDIPLLVNLSSNLGSKDSSNLYSFIYAGFFYYDIRNPEYLCKLFYEFSKKKKISFEIYSSGSKECMQLIEKYSDLSKGCIKNYGLIPRNQVIKKLLKSNIIISLGSKNCRMTPSKIFEYMSTGKKIIHIVSDKENDVAIPYLKKYPNILFVYESDSIDLNISKTEAFISKNIIKVDISDLKKKFKENTPEYTGNIILKNKKR